MNGFCPEHSDMVEFRGSITTDVTHIKNTVNNISEKIDGLTANGIKRDAREATRYEVEESHDHKLRRREHGWAHIAVVSAASAGGILLIQNVLPKMLKALVEVLK